MKFVVSSQYTLVHPHFSKRIFHLNHNATVGNKTSNYPRSTIPVFKSLQALEMFKSVPNKSFDNWNISKDTKTNHVVFHNLLSKSKVTNIENVADLDVYDIEFVQNLIIQNIAIIYVDNVLHKSAQKQLVVSGTLWVPPTQDDFILTKTRFEKMFTENM
uniref:Uncharacterized protein n=1 Tax=Pyramimonas orientalis virus TaxID=455367 RepID=A0A7M3UPB9_POV01|nr:hypothetical protein HWQ62_00467 [Pyramimonas orientalis virus]